MQTIRTERTQLLWDTTEDEDFLVSIYPRPQLFASRSSRSSRVNAAKFIALHLLLGALPRKGPLFFCLPFVQKNKKKKKETSNSCGFLPGCSYRGTLHWLNLVGAAPLDSLHTERERETERDEHRVARYISSALLSLWLPVIVCARACVRACVREWVNDLREWHTPHKTDAFNLRAKEEEEELSLTKKSAWNNDVFQSHLAHTASSVVCRQMGSSLES